eukprot:9432549-Pyramimonas_sp.AAC.1
MERAQEQNEKLAAAMRNQQEVERERDEAVAHAAKTLEEKQHWERKFGAYEAQMAEEAALFKEQRERTDWLEEHLRVIEAKMAADEGAPDLS